MQEIYKLRWTKVIKSKINNFIEKNYNNESK